MSSLLFDSFALLRFFQKEPGGDKVRNLIRRAIDEGTPRLLNAINLGELIYITQCRFGDQKKLEMLAHIHRMEFTILPCPNDLIFRAAELKARYPISYADSFALASAMEHGATLVTGDPEFRKVEHLVGIVWAIDLQDFINQGNRELLAQINTAYGVEPDTAEQVVRRKSRRQHRRMMDG